MSFLPLRRAGLALLAALVVADAGFSIVACSSTSPFDEPSEASAESSTPDGTADAPVQPDGGVDVTTCNPVKGPCDLILQDCPDKAGKKQECVVTGTTTFTTECIAQQASQQLPTGRACCPGTQANPGNPCLPGLTCVGRPCDDAGGGGGRCSPACCKGDDSICGKSDPEGITGACDLTLVADENQPIHDVCSYRERCKPFQVERCKVNQICLVEDKIGTASCLSSFGKTNRQPCTFANECADGLICIGGGDAGQCRTACLTPGSVHPFDASVEEGGPGAGGCPAGEQCRINFTDLPPWYGACAYPDGG
ncbi:MAG: hypothetical protein KF819_22325 [Labilithrix sp.]|nr:hypothetical protein [Labilithrix sp.]